MSIPISVYDTTLTKLTEVDLYKNFYYTRSLSKPGSWQLQINSNLKDDTGFSYADYFQRGRFILAGADTKKIGVITEVSKSIGKGGKASQMVTVKGQEATAILARRLVETPAGSSNYTHTAVSETVIKNLITSQIGSGATASRIVSLINVVSTGGRGSSYQLSSRYKNLLEEIGKISNETAIGYYFNLNLATTKLDFDVIVGIDRTAQQYTNTRMIISTDFDTLESGKITDSEITYKNIVYAAGQGVGDSRNIQKVYDTTEPTGIERREIFDDMRDIATTAELQAKATGVLAANAVTKFVDASSLVYTQYQIGVDYDLGDYITIDVYGEYNNVQITSIKESWSNGKYTIDFDFNKSYPELPTVIKSNNNDIGKALVNTEISAWKPYPAGTYVFPSGNQTVAEGVLAMGATTTAPTWGTTTTKNAWYRDNGETIDIRLELYQTSNTGNINGNGTFLLPMPLGIIGSSSMYPFLSSNTFDGSAFGNAKIASATEYMSGFASFRVNYSCIQIAGPTLKASTFPNVTWDSSNFNTTDVPKFVLMAFGVKKG